ncbi:MAG: hypothetical protein JST00_47385 [Deltaproteobacteria bacterium]|nr:hypothetical protein [Deltaproteobacteria bacterium]
MAEAEIREERDAPIPERRRSGSFAALKRRVTGAKSRMALVRRTLVPLVLTVVPIFWVWDAARRASLTTLGRDQGIFQYIAWAVGQGQVDYRDVRDVNGPLVHLIHRIMLALGGWDEHRFHLLDLWATGLSFFAAGMCLPGLVSKTRPRLAERIAWGCAAAVVLGAQYHLYLYWDQGQRESFCDWFLLPSIALQAARPAATSRDAGKRVIAIAALSTITWFGKPPFALFTIMQLGALLIDNEVKLRAKEKIFAFVVGGALGAVIPLFYLLRWGDIASFLRITLVDVPMMYRFIWAKAPTVIFGDAGPLHAGAVALASAALIVVMVAERLMPRRALVIAFAPVCGIFSVMAQHKGFGYHFHPMTATSHMGFLAVTAMLWERFRVTPRSRSLGRHAALAVAVAYAAEVTTSLQGSPHLRNVWILYGGETPERRAAQEYFDTFKTYDFFPWDLRQGAAYLAEKTAPDARVQTHGMDPYLLFLARRLSATPYIYLYDVNDDAALEGGWAVRPTPQEWYRIHMTRESHEKDMLARLKASPPEAFVFIDNSPLASEAIAWEDYQKCCVESSIWVESKYRETGTFGVVHIWLRNDLADREDREKAAKPVEP